MPPAAPSRAPASAAGSPSDAPGAGDPLPGRLARGLDWETVLRAVLDRNPSVAAARARWKASLERHPQAATLPDPVVEFEIYTFNAMAPDGPTRVDTRLRQEIPLPGTLIARGDIALVEARMERLRYDAALRDAVAEAREAWLEIGYLDRAREALEAQEAVYARYAAAAAGGLATGRTTLPDEVRARSLLAQAGYDRLLTADLRRVEEQRLRSLLDLPREAVLGPAPAAALRPLPTTLDDVLSRAETRSQEIAMAGLSLERAGLERSLARWESGPGLNVGGTWMKDMMEDSAGRILNSRAVSVGVTVPLWFGAKAARMREAESLEAAAAADRSAAIARVRDGATRLFFRAVNGERLVVLYRDTLLPQADRSLVLAEERWRDGTGSLAGAVEAAAARESLVLALHRALADHGQAAARLEQTVGAALGAPRP
jgi:outer membrane protein TolC